jgi:hypothetical protein
VVKLDEEKNFIKSLRKEYAKDDGYLPTFKERNWLIKEYGINALQMLGAKKLLD